MRFLLEIFIIIVLLLTLCGLIKELREYMTVKPIDASTNTIYIED